MSEKFANSGLSMWAEAAKKTGIESVSTIDEGKEDTMRWLRTLNLPSIQTLETTISEFLQDPDSFLSQFDSKLYYASMSPVVAGWGVIRERNHSMPRDEAINFINEVGGRGNYKDLILAECYDHVFAGCLTVSSDESNSIHMEMISGGLDEILHGRTPEMIMERRGHTGFMHYTGTMSDERYSDEYLRRMFQNTLECIPHKDGDSSIGRGCEYYPGFYELFWTYRNEGEKELKPMFYSYTDKTQFNNWFIPYTP